MGTRLSRLQKAMLRMCYPLRGRVDRRRFHALSERGATEAKDIVDVVTKALERLITRGLLIGAGTRTQTRWYITHVRLTSAGRHVARTLLGKQQTLPFQEGKNVHTGTMKRER